MKFKYHKSYRGFYLLEDNKFKRPYQKLDQEKTLENLNEEIEFDKKEIIEIADKYVVFVEKDGGKVSQRRQRNQKLRKKSKQLTLKY